MTELQLIRIAQFILMGYVAYWAIRNLVLKPVDWLEKTRSEYKSREAKTKMHKCIVELQTLESDDAEMLRIRDEIIALSKATLDNFDTMTSEDWQKASDRSIYLCGQLEARERWLKS